MAERFLLLVLLLCLSGAGILAYRRQERRLRALERELDILNKRLFAQSRWIEALDQRLDGAAPPGQLAPAPSPPAEKPPAPPARHAPPQPAPIAPAPARPKGNGPWKRLERRLIQNWTGILGVVAVVAGVTFVAINVALRLQPFQRFLVTSAVALAMAAPTVWIGRRQRWRDLCDWLRSGGASLFLFACTAAGAYPGLGLQWIQDPGPALALISLGVVANLALAGIARSQTIASLHVVVNLVPLMILDPTGLTLAVATGVALVGVVLPLRRRWHGHLLVVSWAYATYQASWFLRCRLSLADGGGLRLAAAMAAVLVFGGGALLAHRARAMPQRLEALPLAMLLSNWGALALALLIYPQQAATRATALAAAAVSVLLLSRLARRRGSRWLQLSDALTAQGFALAALLSLRPLIVDIPLLVFILLLESLAFLALAVVEKEIQLRRVGWFLVNLISLVLVMAGLIAAVVHSPPAVAATQLQNSSILIGAATLVALMQTQLERHRVALPLPPLLGWLAGGMVFVGAALSAPQGWRPWLGLLAMGGLLALARRLRPSGLLMGIAGAVMGLHGVVWMDLLAGQPWEPQRLLIQLGPLAALALILIWADRPVPCPDSWPGLGPASWRWVGMALLGFDAGLGAWLWFAPLSPLLPGVAWLLLALLALEGADRLDRSTAPLGLLLQLGYLGAFTSSYLLVISRSTIVFSLGSLELRWRLVIELLAIAVLLHGWFFRARGGLAAQPLWGRIQPCFLEAVLVGVNLTILSEVEGPWRPLAWTLLALAMLSPWLCRIFAIRLQLYAVIIYWLALAAGLAQLSPSSPWTGQPRGIALAGIALQTGFVVASHRWLDRVGITQPGGVPALAWLGRRVANRRNLLLYLPLFLAVACFLASRYDSALLTLLWAAEAFSIYVLGALLRENQFRSLSLLGLGICLLRLLVIDMAEADLGLRGLVFIGVGLLMLAMNVIYNRFGNRFD